MAGATLSEKQKKLLTASAFIQNYTGKKPGHDWWGLAAFLRPLFALCLVPYYVIVWLFSSVLGVIGDVGSKRASQWSQGILDYLSNYKTEFRLGLALLVCLLYSAIQALTIFAAMQGFLLGDTSIATHIVGTMGTAMIPFFAGYLAFNTGIVNYTLARSFLPGVFLGKVKGIPFAKLEPQQKNSTWLKLLLGAVCTIGAASVSAAITLHALNGLQLLQGLGAVGSMIPMAGAIATAVVYSVFFFMGVYELIQKHAEKTAHNNQWADQKGATSQDAPKQVVSYMGILFALCSLVGLGMFVFVGFGDMMKDMGWSFGTSMTCTVLNAVGGAYFFGAAGYAFGAWFSKACSTISFENLVWGFQAMFVAERKDGSILYTQDQKSGVNYIYKDGRYQGVTPRAVDTPAPADDSGMKIKRCTTDRMVFRGLMFVANLFAVTLTIAVLAGLVIGGMPTGLPIYLLLGVSALKMLARGADGLYTKWSVRKDHARARKTVDAQLKYETKRAQAFAQNVKDNALQGADEAMQPLLQGSVADQRDNAAFKDKDRLTVLKDDLDKAVDDDRDKANIAYLLDPAKQAKRAARVESLKKDVSQKARGKYTTFFVPVGTETPESIAYNAIGNGMLVGGQRGNVAELVAFTLFCSHASVSACAQPNTKGFDKVYLRQEEIDTLSKLTELAAPMPVAG